MRIVVMSDSHGNVGKMNEIVQKHERDSDLFIFLGDGERDFEKVKQNFPKLSFLSVRGNCDFGDTPPLTAVIRREGVTIFYTHGHIYKVKYMLYDLMAAAGEYEANLALYGHTHQAKISCLDGLQLMNPGSISTARGGAPSYGLVDVAASVISCRTDTI